MSFTKRFTIFAFALITTPVAAQGYGRPGTSSGTSGRSTGEAGNTSAQRGTMPGVTGGQSTNSGAGLTRATQLVGAGMNVGMGAMFWKQYKASCAGGATCAWPLAAMSVASYANAGLSVMSAMQANRVEGATGMPGVYFPPGTDPNDPQTWPESVIGPEGKAAYADLTKAGFQFTKDGSVKLPDGTLVNPKALGSAEGLAAAGVPSGSIDGILSTIDAINEQATKQAEAALNGANVVAMGVDGSGGGGGGYRGPAGLDEGGTNFDDYLNRLRNPFGLSNQQKQNMLAGKTITHGADQIGVKAEDIFRMVHRRYQEIRAKEEFIEPVSVASGDAPANAPAGSGRGAIVTPKGR